MSVFLIQTNGRDIHEAAQPEYIQGANGPTFVDGLLHNTGGSEYGLGYGLGA